MANSNVLEVPVAARPVRIHNQLEALLEEANINPY